MKNKVAVSLLALAVAAGMLSGCQGTTEKKTVEKSENTDVEEEKAEVAEKHMNVGATTGFFGAESLDPGYNWDGWIMSIYGIAENLFRLDDNLTPQPWLCESYENTDDLTWVLTLRDDVNYSNGNKMTAESVKKCFERTAEMNPRFADTVAIESMEAEGQVLTVKTSRPEPTLLNDLCDPLMAVYDADAPVDKELGAVCTGPYVATAFEAMTEVQLKKNVGYWGGEPKLDTLDLKIIDDQEALNMALQNGEIDMIAQMPANSTDLFTDTEVYTTESVTSTRANFLMYNLQTPAMQDVNVRNALSMAIDRESYTEVVFKGFAEASYGIYPSMLSYGGTEGLDLAVSEFDPEGAAELLEKAGYKDSDGDGILDKNGENLSLNFVTYSYNTELLQFADMYQAQLSELGVELNVETYDVLDDTMESGNFDIAALNYAMAPTGSEVYFSNMVFLPGASNNYNGYENERVNEIAETLAETYEKEERDNLMRKMQQEIIDDGAYAFFADQKFTCIYRNEVSGFDINPSEYYLITNTLDINE